MLTDGKKNNALMDWLNKEIADTEDWIDMLRQKSKVATFYEGYRAGLVRVRDFEQLGTEPTDNQL